jgi:phenylalanyl-tRNA synthetase beta chain
LKHWSEAPRAVDLFDLKGAVDLAAELTGVPAPAWEPGQVPFLRAGACAVLGGKKLPWGYAGELRPDLLVPLGVQEPVFVAEISLSPFLAARTGGSVPRHAPLSRAPTMRRDLSLILDRGCAYSEVERTLREMEDPSITRVTLFDRYQGKPVPEGKVALAVQIVFQAPGRTLVTGEVAQTMDRIVQRLRDRLGAVLRGN